MGSGERRGEPREEINQTKEMLLAPWREILHSQRLSIPAGPLLEGLN